MLSTLCFFMVKLLWYDTTAKANLFILSTHVTIFHVANFDVILVPENFDWLIATPKGAIRYSCVSIYNAKLLIQEKFSDK